jgi:hypothetical protein
LFDLIVKLLHLGLAYGTFKVNQNIAITIWIRNCVDVDNVPSFKPSLAEPFSEGFTQIVTAAYQDSCLSEVTHL